MSFEALVHKISPTLKRITKRLNGHHSFFDDDDLYQEALFHLWINYGSGKLIDKTDSYILQGCYFHLRNYLRKAKDNAVFVSLNTPVGESGDELEGILAAEGNVLFDHIEIELEREAAENQYLTERERKVMLLSLEGMSIREIGAKLGISHVMVLKVRNRIKEKYWRRNSDDSTRCA